MQGAKATKRRYRAIPGALAACTALTGLAACTTGAATTSTVSVPDEHVLYFGPATDGASVVTSAAISTVATPGAETKSTPLTVPTGSVSDKPAGGSVDVSGQPWWVGGDAVPRAAAGIEHPAAPQIRALERPVASGDVRHTDPWGTAVVDGTSVLVATNTMPGTTFWKAANSVVYQATPQGAKPVAGGGGESAERVSTLQARSLEATSVRLDLVQGIASLTTDSFALLMTAPTDDDATNATLEAAYVTGGMVSSVPLPGQCAGQHVARAVRASDTSIVVSAPHHDPKAGCTTTMDWVVVDLPPGSVTTLGSGNGYAYLEDSGRLVTATRTADDPKAFEIRWQDRSGG